MKSPVVVPVDQLIEEPYASVLCFPKPSKAEQDTRIEELKKLGVTALEFYGNSSLFGVPAAVLGKGFVGVVVIAHLKSLRVAVKIRRLDADRADLLHESEMLRKANSANVAPKLIAASKNFLLMQLIEGDLLPNWLKTNKDKTLVKGVLSDVLKNCYKLDLIGLDHGELSKAPKHVIIDQTQKSWIVDFETASITRKTANLSAMSHFLFSSAGEVARTVTEILGERNQEEIVDALQKYKRKKNQESYEKVIAVCLG